MDNILNKVEAAIDSGSSNLMRTLSLDIDNKLLEENIFPEWCFDLFARLFRDDKFCSAKGSEHFILVVYSNFEKLNTSQREFLYKIFTTDYERFANKMLLHSVADFIARKYPPYLTLKSFQIAYTQRSEAGRYVALAGSEIITMNKNYSEKEKFIAANLIKKITNIKGVRHD